MLLFMSFPDISGDENTHRTPPPQCALFDLIVLPVMLAFEYQLQHIPPSFPEMTFPVIVGSEKSTQQIAPSDAPVFSVIVFPSIMGDEPLAQ